MQRILCNGIGNQDSKRAFLRPRPKRGTVRAGRGRSPPGLSATHDLHVPLIAQAPPTGGRQSRLRHARPAHHLATHGPPALPSPSTSPAHHPAHGALVLHFPGARWHWARPRHRRPWGTVLVGGVGGHGEPPRPAPGGWWDAGGAEGGREANLAALGEGSLQPH